MEDYQAPNNNKYSFWKRLRNIMYIAAHEAANGKPYQWALLGATATGLVFEWGPGNEWLIGSVGANTHELFDPSSITELVATSGFTGVAAGVASTAEQGALGILMSGTVRTFPKAFKEWDATREHTPLEDSSSNKGDIITGIALGTSAVVIEKNAQNPERTLNEDVPMVIKTSAVIGALNVALVTSVSIAVRTLDNLGYENFANGLEYVAKNPLTYLAIFGVHKAIQYRKTTRIDPSE